MSYTNQTSLHRRGFQDVQRTRKALDILLSNRKNEFRELAISVIKDISVPIIWENWDEFILSLCLEVETAFHTWTGKSELQYNSDLKVLIILRQFAKEKATMIQLTHLLNIAYYLAVEFKMIYKQIE